MTNNSTHAQAGQPAPKKLLSNPVTWLLLGGAAVVWFATGAQPFGFPKGEYVCEARSGIQDKPISVFHVGDGKINVVEYDESSSEQIHGVSYTHSMFDRDLNLYVGDASYYCNLR